VLFLSLDETNQPVAETTHVTHTDQVLFQYAIALAELNICTESTLASSQVQLQRARHVLTQTRHAMNRANRAIRSAKAQISAGSV
jgi:hypothetical protein